MAKYRTFVDAHPAMNIECIKNTGPYKYWNSDMDYDLQGVVKFKTFSWEAGEKTIVPIYLRPSTIKVIEETKDLKEVYRILNSSTFPVSYVVNGEKKIFQFNGQYFKINNIQTSESEAKIIQLQEEKLLAETKASLIFQCSNAFTVLNAAAKKDMNASQFDDFKRRLWIYNDTVKQAQSIEGLKLEVKEVNLLKEPVRVNVGKKTVFVKPKPKPKKSKKKKVSGYEDGPEEIGEIGLAPVIAWLIIGIVGIGAGTYVALDFIKKRAQIKKIAESFAAQAKNNSFLLEVAKAEKAGTITPNQANTIFKQVEKSNAAAAEVIATNSPTEKKSMFDDVQTTILYAGAALIAYNLTKK